MITQADFMDKALLVTTSAAKPAVVENLNNNHHKLDAGYYVGSSIGGQAYTNVYRLDLGAGNDTVYLPYYQNSVSSVRLPHTQGATFFVTDNLSGCAIYITRNAQNRLVVYHANTQRFSTEKELKDKAPSFQNPQAVGDLTQYRTNAMTNHRDTPALVASLTKKDYLGAMDHIVKKNSEYNGGVTVAGWRAGTSWEFWFQVFGSVNKGPNRVLYAKQFFQS